MHVLLGYQFQYMFQRSVFRKITEQNETVIVLNCLNVLTAPKKCNSILRMSFVHVEVEGIHHINFIKNNLEN